MCMCASAATSGCERVYVSCDCSWSVVTAAAERCAVVSQPNSDCLHGLARLLKHAGVLCKAMSCLFVSKSSTVQPVKLGSASCLFCAHSVVTKRGRRCSAWLAPLLLAVGRHSSAAVPCLLLACKLAPNFRCSACLLRVHRAKLNGGRHAARSLDRPEGAAVRTSSWLPKGDLRLSLSQVC